MYRQQKMGAPFKPFFGLSGIPQHSTSGGGWPFLKFDIFGCFWGFGGSAGVDKGVLYRETHSQVWNRSEERFGEGGLAGARVRRRLCRRAGLGGARGIFLLGSTACRDRTWLRV